MCSKCHREWQQAEAKARKKQKSDNEGAVAVEEKVGEEEVGTIAHVEQELAPEPVVGKESKSADQVVAGEEEKPVQKNRNRCFCCNKKVGLLGFDCRCGYVFCSGHRHAADHDCTFDFAALDRKKLSKDNPLVAASKIEKL
jgi:hypothetical protein